MYLTFYNIVKIALFSIFMTMLINALVTYCGPMVWCGRFLGNSFIGFVIWNVESFGRNH